MDDKQELPQGFISLDDASTRYDEDLSFMGVVKDFLPPTPTKGTGGLMPFCLLF